MHTTRSLKNIDSEKSVLYLISTLSTFSQLGHTQLLTQTIDNSARVVHPVVIMSFYIQSYDCKNKIIKITLVVGTLPVMSTLDLQHQHPSHSPLTRSHCVHCVNPGVTPTWSRIDNIQLYCIYHFQGCGTLVNLFLCSESVISSECHHLCLQPFLRKQSCYGFYQSKTDKKIN